MRMTPLAIGDDFSLKIWGSHRVYLYAEPEWFDTMIICESMRIRHELNTNWYAMQWDAIICNTMATRCNTKQHGGDGESIRLRYDVMRTRYELIGTYANQCEHVRSNTTMRSLRIVWALWVRRPIRMFLKCSKHSYWPCESKPIRIASNCIAERRINSCQFLLVRISSLYIRIDSLSIRTGICRLSDAAQFTLQYDAQGSHFRIGSHMFALVRVSSYLFLSCSHHTI